MDFWLLYREIKLCQDFVVIELLTIDSISLIWFRNVKNNPELQ